MARRLPPLNALRAFEAAARHLSFTKAAEELNVTQAAVSHQVKALEQHLGLKLFRRLNRALLLTEQGQVCLATAREAFDRIAETAERLRASDARGTLTVSLLPSFAAKWLVPRLGRFRQAHPDIDVRVAPDERLVDFARDDVDVGIRYGDGRYPGLNTIRLLEEEVFPVCSPALGTADHPIRTPADLTHHTLLHDEGHDGWRTWLLAADLPEIDPTRGPIFTDSSNLVQAAVEGQGVALARGALAAADLAAERLVRPFAFSLPGAYAYYIVCPKATAETPKVKAFTTWLLAEAQAP
jgi:LysR family glycine cleavage system transcriptional activator